jgi:bacteriorhodopsin
MEENLRWLWYAFGAAWVIHILYVYSIASRAKDLRAQIDNLKTLLKDQERKTNP